MAFDHHARFRPLPHIEEDIKKFRGLLSDAQQSMDAAAQQQSVVLDLFDQYGAYYQKVGDIFYGKSKRLTEEIDRFNQVQKLFTDSTRRIPFDKMAELLTPQR